MAITDPLLLPKDVILVPVADLPEEVRRQLDHDPGDWALTRPRSRTPSRIVDADSAELLALFKEPRTIVDAVIRFSRERAADPRETLEQAYPLLQRLVGSGFLVPEGEEDAAGIRTSLEPGAEIAGFEVVDNVQVLEDTELHQVRRGGETAALKIERPGAAGKTVDSFAREAAILKHLEGDGAPRLLAAGEVDGRSYLALEWCPGVDAATAAAELRRRDRARLLVLCRAVARAYARLHERGVVHGDVHPRNVLVTREGEVCLIDFGIARWEGASGELANPGRGGVAFFFEPEYAMAVRAGQPPPEASLEGEQYGVAALLYLLATGAHSRDFSLEKKEMLRQVAEEPPLPFAARGAEPWPELEEILIRALSKDPGERFPSLAALAEALGRIPEPAVPVPGRTADLAAAEALLGRVLERVRRGGPLWTGGLSEAPRGSVNYGAAGVAYALYRISLVREDAFLLSSADLWAARALRGVGAEESFYNPDIEITPKTVGRVSPYHTANGLFSVQALVAHALGDLATQREAVAAFVSGGRERCDNPDLTLGRSGVLLASSLLLDTLSADDPVRSELLKLGDHLLAGLWEELDPLPPVPLCDFLPNLGMAHGWAGYLYATLRWCRAAGRPRPARLEERLKELAACAQPWGRGLRWRWGTSSMPGWCNGSAGFVFLWTLAHRDLGDPAFSALAEGAAWNTWEAPDGGGSLCCGLAGRAYALLNFHNFHRHGGGPEWLERARELANRAAVDIVQSSEREDSLYKGTVGVALLAAEIARPEAAAMPFFEEEGWG